MVVTDCLIPECYIDTNLVETVADNGSIYLLRHRQRPHYILQISPAVEMFVLGAVAEKGLRLEDYGLPSDLEGLKRRTKTVKSKRDVAFRQLFKVLADTTQFRLLGNVLRYLVERNYDADTAELKRLFSEDRING